MARYRVKPCEVEAVQWFQNGDHPLDYANEATALHNGELVTVSGAECKANGWEGQLVRYYRRPDVAGRALCGHCKKPMHAHGWIEQDDTTVCPGAWVLTEDSGRICVLDDAEFHECFELMEG